MNDIAQACGQQVPGSKARCTRAARHVGSCKGEPCGASCWHKNYVVCTRTTGHSGKHAAHGARYPGAPEEGPVVCAWKGTG